MIEALRLPVNVYAIFTLLLLLLRLEWGLLLLIPLAPLMTYTFRTDIVGLNLSNFLVYTAFAMGLLRRIGKRGPLPPATWPIVVFFGITLFTWVIGWLNFRGNTFPYQTWRWFVNIERWVLFTLLYFAYFFGWSSRISPREGFVWMVVGLFILGSYNVIEAVRPTEYRLVSERAGGLFGQANANGIFLASYALLPVVFALSARTALRRALSWGVFALSVFGVFLSVSRTGIICLVLGVLVFFYYASKRALAFIAIFLCLAIPIAPLVLPKFIIDRYESTLGESGYQGVAGKFEGSTANRVVQNEAGVKLFIESPIIGHGLGGFYYRSPKYLPPGAPDVTRSAHSTFLELATEGGVVALVSFVWLLASLALAGKQLYEAGQDYQTKLLGSYMISCLASKIAANFAGTEFLTGDVTAYVWISAALVSRLYLQVRGAPSAVVQTARTPWRPRARPEIRPPVMHG